MNVSKNSSLLLVVTSACYSPACFRIPNTMLVYLSKSPSMAMAMSPNSEITWGFTDLGEDFSGVKSNLCAERGRVWNTVGSRVEQRRVESGVE